jgi:type I restriction enzyme S subunit
MQTKTPVKWVEKTLGEACLSILDGDWIESKNQSTMGIRLIQTGNVGLGYFKNKGEKARYISEEIFKNLNCTEIYPDDCLVSRLPDPIGRACLIPNIQEQMITAVDCAILKFNKDIILPKFFVYYSQSNLYLNDVKNKATGATRQRISRTNLSEISIKLPPLDEQERIVGILDEVFKGLEQAKANLEANLKNAKELFETTLNKKITYDNNDGKIFKLSDVCSIESTLIDPQEKSYEDLLHIGGANIESGTGKLINLKTAKEESLISGKFCFNKNMILYSKIRPYLMKIARPDFNGLCSADIYPLLPNNKITKDYLFYLLLAKHFTDYAIEGSARAGMPKLNRPYLFNYEFRLPDVCVQKEASSILNELNEEISNLIQVYNKQLANLEELKQSVLQKAFSGNL